MRAKRKKLLMQEGQMYNFSGKVALVTGAATKMGIGHAVAIRMAEEGADVGILDVPKEFIRPTEEDVLDSWQFLDSVTEEIKKLGRKAVPLYADISNSAQVDKAVAECTRKLGKVDILVHCAAIQGPVDVPLADLSDKDWNQVIAVNLTGAFFCCRAAAKGMRERGKGGKIVVIDSCAGKVARPLMGAYVASKFGLLGIVQSFAIELAKYKINVNAICPGAIVTEIYVKTVRKDVRELGISREEAIAKAYADEIATIPMGRVGQPSEVAGLVAFLASNESDHMTGQAVNLTGGQYMAR